MDYQYDPAGSPLKPEFTRGLASVIIPTRNRGSLIAETIRSVINQDYPKIEIIVVDDGSTDNTAGIISGIAGSLPDTRTLVYRFQDRAGAPRARNSGMALARGEYIQFLDSDDLLHPRKISTQAGILGVRADLDLSIGQSTHFRSRPRMAALHRRPVAGPVTLDTYESSSFYCPDPLCRRVSLEKVGPWDETLAYGQDHNFFGRALALGLKAEYTPGIFSFIRAHGDNLGNVLDPGTMLESRGLSDEGIVKACAKAGVPVPRAMKLRMAVSRSDLCATNNDRKGAVRALRSAFAHLPGHYGMKHVHLGIRSIVLLITGIKGYLLLGRTIRARTRIRKAVAGY